MSADADGITSEIVCHGPEPCRRHSTSRTKRRAAEVLAKVCRVDGAGVDALQPAAEVDADRVRHGRVVGRVTVLDRKPAFRAAVALPFVDGEQGRHRSAADRAVDRGGIGSARQGIPGRSRVCAARGTTFLHPAYLTECLVRDSGFVRDERAALRGGPLVVPA
ncbi:hypothetical protein [Streptomyces sp.]|uniref:hypothetical protein n=1 Tax=Streptomyces sp. TaxID=1931 RepID=UPI0028112C1E|nr:hypothetical protein [Streptomyces sp.]